jgi:hypothetical protein
VSCHVCAQWMPLMKDNNATPGLYRYTELGFHDLPPGRQGFVAMVCFPAGRDCVSKEKYSRSFFSYFSKVLILLYTTKTSPSRGSARCGHPLDSYWSSLMLCSWVSIYAMSLVLVANICYHWLLIYTMQLVFTISKWHAVGF